MNKVFTNNFLARGVAGLKASFWDNVPTGTKGSSSFCVTSGPWVRFLPWYKKGAVKKMDGLEVEISVNWHMTLAVALKSLANTLGLKEL